MRTKLEWIEKFPDWEAPHPNDIKELIMDSGLTQAEFGRLVGCSARCIQNYCAPQSSLSHRPIPYSVWRLAMHEMGLLSYKPTETETKAA